MSLIQFLLKIRHGRKPVTGEATHHWITGTPLYRPLQDAIAAGIPIVAVHRDPYERIRSAYQHRVVKEREAVARSFGEFCEHLAQCRAHPSIASHTGLVVPPVRTATDGPISFTDASFPGSPSRIFRVVRVPTR